MRLRTKVYSFVSVRLCALLQLLVVGLSTLLTISTEQGQLLFGEKYKEYDYFLVKHAVAVTDPRGDQVSAVHQWVLL